MPSNLYVMPEPETETLMALVTIKDGRNHGRRDFPEHMKNAGDLYVASGDEVDAFGDKFNVLDLSQAVVQIAGATADRVVALAEHDFNKAQYLIGIEEKNKSRKTLLADLGKIEPAKTERDTIVVAK